VRGSLLAGCVCSEEELVLAPKACLLREALSRSLALSLSRSLALSLSRSLALSLSRSLAREGVSWLALL
jgi:hypothetical protein